MTWTASRYPQPRATREVVVSLDTLDWDTIATTHPDDIPAETPYLWTIFFKADGSTLRVKCRRDDVGRGNRRVDTLSAARISVVTASRSEAAS
jgi:hypothetical protein